jgi:AraC family transcriptional regulator
MMKKRKEIIIKNVVCPRCVKVVRQIFEEEQVNIIAIDLGKITVEDIKKEQIVRVKQKLLDEGFKWLDDKKAQLVARIKAIIIQEIHHKTETRRLNLSVLLSKELHYTYSYLSKVFSSIENQSVSSFIIAQKIEKIKELLIYNELSLSEISFLMDYSSTSHLSNQFKIQVGVTPSEFKKLKEQKRVSLDDL